MGKQPIELATGRTIKINKIFDHENRLGKIEAKLESFATKEDLHRELNSFLWKLITAIIMICSLTVAILKL